MVLVSEACLSCTASVMLFHSSFISSTIPFSDLMAQFTDTAFWEVLPFGVFVCVRVCLCVCVHNVIHCHIFFPSAFQLTKTGVG